MKLTFQLFTPRLFTVASILLISGSFAIGTEIHAAEDQIIIDDLSRSELRAEIEKIETEYYRVFNASVNESHLKIECQRYTPTSSHIKQRACEPKFFVDARNENARRYQNGTDVLQTQQALRDSLMTEFEQLTAAMNSTLQESEYFRELNNILRMLRDRMQELDQ